MVTLKTHKHINGPVVRKVIIIRDVQFVENEAWDGTIENNIKIVLTVEHDDMKKEVVKTPHVSQNVRALSTSRTLQHVSTQGTSKQVASQDTLTRTPRGQPTA